MTVYRLGHLVTGKPVENVIIYNNCKLAVQLNIYIMLIFV